MQVETLWQGVLTFAGDKAAEAASMCVAGAAPSTLGTRAIKGGKASKGNTQAAVCKHPAKKQLSKAAMKQVAAQTKAEVIAKPLAQKVLTATKGKVTA